MIDARLYQVGRNARTQDFDSGHRRAQKKSIKSAREVARWRSDGILVAAARGSLILTFLVRFRSHCPSNIDREVATKPRLSDPIHVRLFALVEKDAFDNLRKNRGDRDLHVPLLSGDPGVHWHILHRELKLDCQSPNFTTFLRASPTGTVRTSSDGAVQSARILPEYPTLQPSPKKIDAMGCRFIWFVS
jgi:hypothetical protein